LVGRITEGLRPPPTKGATNVTLETYDGPLPKHSREEWEYTEQDRTTGRPKRVKFAVPRLLDPRDPGSWTNRWGNKDNEDGEIIVCHEGKGEATDIVFLGDPTPDMVPMDDEARTISASFEARWQSKPENSAGDIFQSLVDRFNIDIAEAQSRPVEVPGMAELTSAIGELVKVNQKSWRSSRMDEDLAKAIVRELTKIRELLSDVVNAIRDAETEVPEKMRRFVMYMHDVHDIANMYRELGHDVPDYVMRELERCDDRYRQLLKELHTDGGTFEKVLREMSKTPRTVGTILAN